MPSTGLDWDLGFESHFVDKLFCIFGKEIFRKGFLDLIPFWFPPSLYTLSSISFKPL